MVTNFLHITEAKQKANLNYETILQFLYSEKYSSTKILQALLGYKTPQATRKLLRRMVALGWLKKYRYPSSQTLWGITTDGLARIQPDNKAFDWRYFEPKKVNIKTLEHQLYTQYVHVQCIKSGLTFIPGGSLGTRFGMDKVPDGIVETPRGRIAIEVELHLKSRRRYDSIVYNYLKAVKEKHYQKILYVSPNEVKMKVIRNAIQSLQHITMYVGGQSKRHQLEKEHLDYFGFTTFAGLHEIFTALSKDVEDDKRIQ